MTKKLYRAVASCLAVIGALVFAEPPSASAIHNQHQGHRHAVSRRSRAARQRVKARTKVNRQHRGTYVCPMHLDIRSKSQGTCPKCLMDLVPEQREDRSSADKVDKENRR